ncbi:unnamed protein product [Adineta steineri]|uniref:Uncharacterized protein n=2 Tax=Adineta steineri TaxID=433720 RepID=A0A814UWA8_9BILA|nr:unnamed protein product [Adineta steineri]
MHRILLILSYVVFISYINGASSRSRTSVKRDAIELADLYGKFWASKPAVFNKVEPFIYCRVLETCCEEKQRQEAIPLSFFTSFGTDDRDRFLEIVGSCVNSTEQNGGDKWCQTYSQEVISSEDLRSNAHATQFAQLAMPFLQKLSRFEAGASDSCDNEEKYAMMCLSNKKLTQRCVHKTLKDLIKQFGYKSYKKLLTENKQALIDISQQWFTRSIKDEETN